MGELPGKTAVSASVNFAADPVWDTGIRGVEHRLTALLDFHQIADVTSKNSKVRLRPSRTAIGGFVKPGVRNKSNRAPAYRDVDCLRVRNIWIDNDCAEFRQVEY